MATTVSLKLLIDPVSHKVLFAEAGKDFVDFLFNIMLLPVGSVIRLLSKHEMVGCLGNLYESIEKLGDTYMQPTANKDTLLKPTVAYNSANYVPLLMPNNIQSSTSVCLSCNRAMNQKASFVNLAGNKPPTSSSDGGYVKGVVTYMVMDDLVVSPMSTISSISLLNKFKIKDVGNLQEKVIDIGMDEGVKLLRESMQSNAVLTAVFLQGKKAKNK